MIRTRKMKGPVHPMPAAKVETQGPAAPKGCATTHYSLA